MTDDAPKRLTVDEARAKAFECRTMATQTRNVSHQVMLRHMADTWDRLAADLDKKK